ncbi:MAG: VacJ family lipoprotein [Opitutales bacterium]
MTLLLACGVGAALHAQDDYLSEEDFYDEELNSGLEISDPLEFINRYTFKFNDFVYLNLLEPLADTYQAVTPDPVEKGASNFFRNLKYPVRLVGNLLQGRLKGAWVETGRFAINTTVGVLGVFRPADEISGFAPIPKEDIGQALGSWGVGEGPYLVIPLLGPSNLRDLGGTVGDRAINPFDEPFSLIDDWSWEWQLALAGSEFIVASPSLIERYKRLKGSAIDPYGSLKNGYTQYRRAAIKE